MAESDLEISEHFDSDDSERASTGDRSNNEYEYTFDSFEEEPTKPQKMAVSHVVQQRPSYTSTTTAAMNKFAQNNQKIGIQIGKISPIRRPVNIGPTSSMIPQMQSMQASLALEEIGKEVIKLRNERMTVFKERLAVANEKKDRALSRRLKYENDMQSKTENISILESKLVSMSKINEDLTQRICSLESDQQNVRDMLAAESNSAATRSREIDSLLETIKKLEKKTADLLQKNEADKLTWENERNDIMQKLRNAEIMAEVQKASNEMMEKKFEAERMELPERQKALINDRMTLIAEKEANIVTRENDLRLDEHRRRDALDQLRKDLYNEVQDMRRRTDENLENERAQLAERSKALEQEKSSFASQNSQTAYALENKHIELTRREHALHEGETLLLKQTQAFEVSVKTFEPQMTSLRYDMEQANVSKKNAEVYWEKVRAQADAVLYADHEIVSKQRELFSLAETVSKKREELMTLKNDIVEKLRLQTSKLKILDGDRFSVYNFAMTMSSEIQNIRQAIMSLEARLQPSTSSAASFMLQDSMKKLDRAQLGIENVIKSLAEKVDSSGNYNDKSSAQRLIEDADDVPKIDISYSNYIPSTSAIIAADSSSWNSYVTEQPSAFKSKMLVSSSVETADVKLSIEAASQSLFNLKALRSKYGVI